jgi:hypothetical protein
VEVRQGPGTEPEVFVTAADPADHDRLVDVLRRKWSDPEGAAPGSAVEDRGSEARLVIPSEMRTGHEAHFAEVLEEFARYFHAPRSVPAWERANVLAKYHITTRAVELARQRRQYA